jgi:hypothetical protein
VRFGGDVTVPADEIVADDVVVFGGNADVDGQVDGDVVVIGGKATLGPNADIRRDVTVVGGSLTRDPRALVRGRVEEVGVGDSHFGPPWFRRGFPFFTSWRQNGLSPTIRFVGTLMRVGLLVLLVWGVMLVAKTPVEQIAKRAAAEPVKSWAIGFLAELLFLPALILTVAVLAISIVGIPLLILVPVVLVGLFVILLIGFTAVAYWIGSRVQGATDRARRQPYLAALVGIAVILSPLLLGRIVGLASGLGFVAVALAGLGILLEYISWTTGLGAAALVQFSRLRASSPASQPPVPPPAEA